MHLLSWYSKSYKHLDKICIISNTLANFATYFIFKHYDDYSWPVLGKNIELFSSYKDFKVQTGFLRYGVVVKKTNFKPILKKIGPIENSNFFDFVNLRYCTFGKC